MELAAIEPQQLLEPMGSMRSTRHTKTPWNAVGKEPRKTWHDLRDDLIVIKTIQSLYKICRSIQNDTLCDHVVLAPLIPTFFLATETFPQVFLFMFVYSSNTSCLGSRSATTGEAIQRGSTKPNFSGTVAGSNPIPVTGLKVSCELALPRCAARPGFKGVRRKTLLAFLENPRGPLGEQLHSI